MFLAGAASFNAKPKQGIAFLEEKGIIAPDSYDKGTAEEKRTKAIARFLRQSSRLDKKLLGEYISRPDQLDLLNAYMRLFDFRGVSRRSNHVPRVKSLFIRQKSVADAMRELLETFRLPGEAQPIARITEVFAEHFFSFRPRKLLRLSGFVSLYLHCSRHGGSGRYLCACILRHHAQYGSTQSSKQGQSAFRTTPTDLS